MSVPLKYEGRLLTEIPAEELLAALLTHDRTAIHANLPGHAYVVEELGKELVRRCQNTELLDWMQARADALSTPEYPRVWAVDASGNAVHYTPLQGTGRDLRAAIRAAMQQPSQTQTTT